MEINKPVPRLANGQTSFFGVGAGMFLVAENDYPVL
jgi:hypothetical protein